MQRPGGRRDGHQHHRQAERNQRHSQNVKNQIVEHENSPRILIGKMLRKRLTVS
jgi:hypothetical protein